MGPQPEVAEEKRLAAVGCLKAARDLAASGDEAAAQQKMDEAWACLEESIRLDSSNNKSRFLLVSCAMNRDDFERAFNEGSAIYNSLGTDQRQNMGDAVLHISLAHACKMLGKVDEAIHFASEAATLYPADPHPRMILGEVFEASGHDAQAESNCREALSRHRDPKCKHPLSPLSVYFTLCCLGAALTKQAKFKPAEDFLMEAVTLDGTKPLARRHLVDAYHFQGRIQEALAMARKLSDDEPEDEEILAKIDILLTTPPASARSGRGAGGSHVSESYRVLEVSGPSSGIQPRDAAEKKASKTGGDFMCCCFDRGDTGK